MDKKNQLLSEEVKPLRHIEDIFYKGVTKESERSVDALRSYMIYEFIRNQEKIKIDESYDCLEYVREEIRIHADLLTNAKAINKRAEELGVQENPTILAFNKVVYTIGNCCPTWKNPASGQGSKNDNIWYKLNLHIIEERDERQPILILNRDNKRGIISMCEKYMTASRHIFHLILP